MTDAPHNQLTWYLLHYIDATTVDYFGAKIERRKDLPMHLKADRFGVRIDNKGIDLISGSLDAFGEWCSCCIKSNYRVKIK